MKKTIDLEPPSSKTNAGTDLKNLYTTLLNYSTNFLKFRDLISYFSTTTKTVLEQLYNLRPPIFNKQFLPHLALIFIVVISIFTNVAQAKSEAALSQQLVSLDYGSQVSILNSIDSYTPLIKADSVIVEQSISSRDSYDGFVVAPVSIDTTLTARVEPLPDNTETAVTYIVRQGDTLSKLAYAFGLKVSTLKYTNDLTSDMIRPGSKLSVPAKGRDVSQAQIAKKEQEKIKLAAANRNTVAREQSRQISVKTYQAGKRGTSINGYPYGWCTYYAASRRNIPNAWGNAGQWLRSASSHGWSTGKSPQAGAIVITSESWMGHVAIVEKVENDKIIISEMNGPAGFGVVGLRSISLDSKKIKGYIY